MVDSELVGGSALFLIFQASKWDDWLRWVQTTMQPAVGCFGLRTAKMCDFPVGYPTHGICCKYVLVFEIRSIIDRGGGL